MGKQARDIRTQGVAMTNTVWVGLKTKEVIPGDIEGIKMVDEVGFVHALVKYAGGDRFGSECACMVELELANGKKLVVGITDEDVSEGMGLWFQVYVKDQVETPENEVVTATIESRIRKALPRIPISERREVVELLAVYKRIEQELQETNDWIMDRAGSG